MVELFKLLDENGLTYIAWIVLAIYLASVAGAWIIAQAQAKSNIEKTDAETTETLFNLKKQLNEYGKKAAEYRNSTRKALENFVDSLVDKDEKKCRQIWHETRALFFDNYFHALQEYLTYYELFYRKRKKQLRSIIKTDIFRFFDCTVLFYETMNNETVLKICGVEKQHIKEESLSGIINYINNSAYFLFDIGIKVKLKNYLSRLEIH